MGSYSGDETKVVATSIQGKNPSIYVSKNEPVIDERKRSELFHIKFMSKHTKNDTLFYSGSQENLISEENLRNYISKLSYTLNHIHLDGYVIMHICKLQNNVGLGFPLILDLLME